MTRPARSFVAPSASAVPVGRRAVQAAYYAFLLWIPLETLFVFQSEVDSPVTVSRLLGVLLFGLAVLTRRISFRRFPPAFWMVAWYVGLFCLSQAWIPTEVDDRFIAAEVTLLQMLALFAISINLFSDVEFRGKAARLYGWCVSLVALAMLLHVFGEPAVMVEGRSTILGQDPNVAAGFFALGAVCIAGDPRLFKRTGFVLRAVMTVAAVAVLIAAILQTGSRGGLLVFVAGMAGLLVCGKESTRKGRLGLSLVVLALLAFMIFQEFQSASSTAQRLVSAVDRGDTAGRTTIWRVAWSMFLEKPLLGYGGANNFTTLGSYLNYVSRDTHNLFLAVLTEVGLVGAVPFIAAIFYAAWKAARYGFRTGNSLPFALMCALIAINLSLTGYHQKLFWIFFAAAVACGLEYDEAVKQARAKPEAKA